MFKRVEPADVPPLKSILVMADRSADAQVALQKAFVIARHFNAPIELLACDPDHPWTARGAGQAEAGERAAAARRLASRRFLDALRSSISAEDLQIRMSEDCEAPLHEGIARKVRAAGHSLVVKRVQRGEGRRRPALSGADWQVIRSCPVPLMLTRGRPWRPLPRFVASFAESGSTTGGRRDELLEVAHYLARGCHGAVEIVHDGVAGAGAGRAGTDAALAAMPAPSDIDVVVLRACGGDQSASVTGAALAERLVETLDCDVLLMPHLPRQR